MKSVAQLLIIVVVACSSDGLDTAKKEGPKPTASATTATASSTMPTASATSATASATTTAFVAGPPRAGWPLPPVPCVMEGLMKACKTAGGEPGVQCPRADCINPCPVGMAPGVGLTMCERLCKNDTECGAGKCTHSGVCDTIPKLPCDGGSMCTLPNGQAGFECSGKCYNPCKPTLALYGGTHCAKPCKDKADCPGGECDADNYCTPLCPAEACPYPWE